MSRRMIRLGTPVEDHQSEWGLLVKREDLSCPGGPRFSKTRGVLAHVAARPELVIGVLDTGHSQGGWAVARACAELGRECHVWFPWYKGQTAVPPQQEECRRLGAKLHRLPAGRSAVLYHAARKSLLYFAAGRPSYMMPNALKLPEMVAETAAEVARTRLPTPGGWAAVDEVIVSISSGTIAAGVVRGLTDLTWRGRVTLHMGYSRSHDQVLRYVQDVSGLGDRWQQAPSIHLVDEGYSYADRARPGPTPPWPANEFYDLKAVRWWDGARNREPIVSTQRTLLWSIG